DVSKSKIFGQYRTVKLGVHSRCGENYFHLGPEDKPAAAKVIVERLDAQSVPGNKETLLSSVPNRKGEHASEVLNAVATVFLVQVDNRLSIAMGPVFMATAHQIVAQAGMVIDFAVKDHPDGTIFIADWLMPGSKVHDAQAAHPYSN